MKKKRITTEVATTLVITITSAMLIANLLKLEPPTIQPSKIEIHIENVDSFQSSIVPVDIQEVEIQNAEPVVNLFYDIPVSDSEQLLIREISNQFGIDYELLLAVIKTESEFNANSIGDNGKSLGLMQIQPKFWTSLFNSNDCSDWFSVKDNVTVGCSILQYLYASYGDTIQVLSAYNSGNPNCNNGYSDKVMGNLYQIHILKR